MLIKRMQIERDDILSKLERLNDQYNHVVHEFGHEQASRLCHHSRHLQLLSTKRLFNLLESLQSAYKQSAFNDFIHYCKFDQGCHLSLKFLAGVLEKVG